MRQMYPIWIILGIFFILWFIRRTVSKKYAPTASRPKLLHALANAYIVFMTVTPFILVFIVELASNRDVSLLRPDSIAAAIVIVAIIELFFVTVLPFGASGMVICYVMAMVLGIANDYLLRLRDLPFMAIDLLEINTMRGITGGYDMTPTTRNVIAFAIGMGSILLAFALNSCYQKVYKDRFKYRYSLIVGAFAAVSFTVIYNYASLSETLEIELNMWRPGNTYTENGAVVSFIAYAQFSTIREPEGYSKEKVSNILTAAEEEFDNTYGNTVTGMKPNIISIMDESFTDYSIYGLKSPNKHIEYYKSLKDDPDTIWHGYTYVSTYGGGTARSEYEYLTGYSMKFFSNAQPYSQFNFTDIVTSVENLKNQGYEAVAMHPENPVNYRRNTVYPQMGFDKFYSYADYWGYEMSDLVGNRVSDSGDFARMIDEEKSNDNPMFFHNVTMQNHGGYEFDIASDKKANVDGKYASVKEFVAFESLITRTDKALKEILDYYRESDEPTIICLYGDHQPNLPETFVNDIMADAEDPSLGFVGNQERRFITPFIIWANFDVEDYLGAYEFRGDTVVSQNYLGVATRAFAGVKLSAFDKYLMMLRREIPVINESGYIAGGEWHSHDEENEYTDLINQYEYVQYAGMFDHVGLEGLFGVQ